MSRTPRLSFCMIARDAAADIVRCLRSVAPLADEMIVVDTGSTDDTAALARECGAAVLTFAWCDDFSAALNAALGRATGDWILRLDADEWLLPECQAAVRGLLARPPAEAYWVMRQEMERADQANGFIEMRQMRLWRHTPRRRYVGRIHEHFGDGVEARAADSSLRIRHTGYLAEFLPAKLERNVRLLALELAERPGQMYYEVELGRAWLRLGDPRGPALLDDILARLLALKEAPTPPTLLAAPVLERCLRHDAPDTPQVHAALPLALRWFPDMPPVLDAAAGALYRRGEFAQAIPLLLRLVHMAETREYDRSLAFAGHVLGNGVFLNLAVCHHRLAQLDEAERWYTRLLERTPDHPGALRNLQTLREQRLLSADSHG